MKARGRHFLGYPRALIGVLVALIATSAALFLFFQAKTQTYSSPLDTLSSQLDAGKDAPDIVEQAESADPAPPSITISTMLDRTAPIESYLRDAGMEPSDAHQWASYIQRIIANRYFQSGHPLTLYKDPETGAMRGIKYDVDQNTTMTAASLGAGVLKAGLRPIEYYIRPIKMTFEVKDNFQHAAAEQGIPKPIVDSLQDAFSDRHDLNRLAPGSAVKLIYQEKVSRDGSYTLVGDVQAAQIRFGSRTLTAISFADEQGRPHLYDEQGHALGPQSLKFPLNFQYISSGFTFHRWHPILHEYRPHVGVDLVAKYGEPVKAVADGKVISAGWQGELGNCIRIQHQHEMVSIYGHLSKISPEVKAGQLRSYGAVDRQCRFDRPFDRASSPLRDGKRRRLGQSSDREAWRESPGFAADESNLRRHQGSVPDRAGRTARPRQSLHRDRRAQARHLQVRRHVPRVARPQPRPEHQRVHLRRARISPVSDTSDGAL